MLLGCVTFVVTSAILFITKYGSLYELTRIWKSGQYQHPAPHATSGVVGDDANIDKSKIEPLDQQAGADKGHAKSAGLGDEEIDAARVQPLGAVREQLS